MLELEPEALATYDGYDRPHCLENTRVSIQEEILAWARSETEENVCLLYGAAGSGKSTIAQTMADHARLLKALGAYMFFVTAESSASPVIRTVVYP